MADDHDRRFTEQSDRIWGAGNWIVCHECPPDDSGRPVRHHKNAHKDARAASGEGDL